MLRPVEVKVYEYADDSSRTVKVPAHPGGYTPDGYAYDTPAFTLTVRDGGPATLHLDGWARPVTVDAYTPVRGYSAVVDATHALLARFGIENPTYMYVDLLPGRPDPVR